MIGASATLEKKRCMIGASATLEKKRCSKEEIKSYRFGTTQG